MERQLVVFELSHEHYGVDIAAVESIIKLQPITVVPHAPSFVEGITNLRGSVLPVIDLRKRFGLSAVSDAGGRTHNSRIIVVIVKGVKVGMIVDGVSEVLSVASEAIEPPPPMVTTLDSTFITGIAKVTGADNAQRLIILLDLNRILSSQEQDTLNLVMG